MSWGFCLGVAIFLEFITDYLNSVNSGQAGIFFLSSLFLIWIERIFFKDPQSPRDF